MSSPARGITFLPRSVFSFTAGQFGITLCRRFPCTTILRFFSAVLGYLCSGQPADGMRFLGYPVISSAAMAMAFYSKRSVEQNEEATDEHQCI